MIKIHTRSTLYFIVVEFISELGLNIDNKTIELSTRALTQPRKRPWLAWRSAGQPLPSVALEEGRVERG